MKKHISLSKKHLALLCVLALCLTGAGLGTLLHKPDAKADFDRLTHALFVREMTSNTLTMHYTIAHPKAYGIRRYSPVLPIYQSGKDTDDATGRLLKSLLQIPKEQLDSRDAYTYTLLRRSLILSDAMQKYTLLQRPLSPVSGMQTQLPILLSEYRFRSRRDIEDYLSLLAQSGAYFDGLLSLEQEKANRGFSMSSCELAQVRRQCQGILTENALRAQEHFLQTTFAERLAEFCKDHSLSKGKADAYIRRHNELLLQVLLPAYEALSDGLYLLEEQAADKEPKGLSAYPGGREYYTLLCISQTGSYRSPSQIKEMLSKRLQAEYAILRKLSASHPQLKDALSSKSYTRLPVTDAQDILRDLRQRMAPDFPAYTGDTPAGTRIKTLTGSLQEYCAPAFYLTSPIDDTNNNVIYINPGSTAAGLELYTTLSHEGYPGHLYQNVYCNRLFAQNGENPVRQLLWYGGYLEGWALYVEFLSFDHASHLLQEQNAAADAICVQLEKHNRSMQLCLYSLLDILIHYENAGPEKVRQLLSSFGINDENTADAIYRYIAESPCNYLKYYLGYLEILSLKQEAKQLWKEDYSDLRFHTFFLECGPSDFCSLREMLYAKAPTSDSP